MGWRMIRGINIAIPQLFVFDIELYTLISFIYFVNM